ncbi:MAG: hypothetical protein LUC90_10955 [Lachnospiraceae bacterium]|nr:hypothetical protein [Lachnospiraceae bacterium]
MDDNKVTNGIDNGQPFPKLEFEREPFRNVKDSVFKWLFADSKYLLQMYQTLHPEDKETTADDLDLVTLETVIIKDIHNDLGFAVGSKLLVLAEAQSTWSVNIIVRSFFYLARTYQKYLERTHQDFYSSKAVELPRAELYVIYTGNSKVTKDEITLSEEFFSGVPCAVDARVKVIVEGAGHDIINQYILFSKVIDEQIKIHGREHKAEAVRETFRICKDRNILKEFIESHEKEAVDIMVQLYDQREAVENYGKSQYAEGKAEGETATMLGNIKNLMVNMKLTAEQAMQALGIPTAEQSRYQAML